MPEVKLLDLITRRLYFHKKSSVYRSDSKSAGVTQISFFSVQLRRNSIYFQSRTSFERYKIALYRTLIQKPNVAFGQYVSFFQFSTFCYTLESIENCEKFRNLNLTQKILYSIGEKRDLSFFQNSMNPYFASTVNCDSIRSPELIQKRSFSVGERRDLRFLQFITYQKPNQIRVGCLKGCCVVDLNASDPCIPNNMLELLRCGVMDRVRK